MAIEIRCVGTPSEVGFAHGSGAKEQVHGSVRFYEGLFKQSTSLDWEAVKKESSQYVGFLEKACPRYLEEIHGIAKGAGLEFLDILALNVRTEINFGLFSDATKKVDVEVDGCTALSWLTNSGQSFLSQNWDWKVEQSPNVVICHISQPGTEIPDFSMVTEAGIIGKIGLNSKGVACCLNAIRARGVDRAKLPTHLALRMILESSSREAAISKVKSLGVAASAHILVGDKTGAAGLECTSIGIKQLDMDYKGRIFHTNHLVLSDFDRPLYIEDSVPRLSRIQELCEPISAASLDSDALFGMLKDEQGYPAAINRQQKDSSASQTIFTIVMDLANVTARVTFGRPTEVTSAAALMF